MTMAGQNVVASSWEELQREIREVAEWQLQEQMKLVANFLELNAGPYRISENKKDSDGKLDQLQKEIAGRYLFEHLRTWQSPWDTSR